MRDFPTHLFGGKGEQLSGVEYDRRVREMDAAFQAAMWEAFQRGEFPPSAYPAREAA